MRAELKRDVLCGLDVSGAQCGKADAGIQRHEQPDVMPLTVQVTRQCACDVCKAARLREWGDFRSDEANSHAVGLSATTWCRPSSKTRSILRFVAIRLGGIRVSRVVRLWRWRWRRRRIEGCKHVLLHLSPQLKVVASELRHRRQGRARHHACELRLHGFLLAHERLDAFFEIRAQKSLQGIAVETNQRFEQLC